MDFQLEGKLAWEKPSHELQKQKDNIHRTLTPYTLRIPGDRGQDPSGKKTFFRKKDGRSRGQEDDVAERGGVGLVKIRE